jgi:uncharacterized protein YjbI with pentapeptide repeats
MSEQDGGQVPIAQRPTNDDKEAWKAYWNAQDQPWRKEPEIDTERQKYLAERRNIIPNIGQGIYPFKGIKLSRADVEWLLATHENGRGSVDWNDENQRKRKGLDLRGADLSQVDLSKLPLALLYGGLGGLEWNNATKEQRQTAAVNMKGANLQGAHLEEATLLKANLEEAFIMRTHLEGADLSGAHLEGANLQEAQLDGAILRGVFFDNGTYMPDISLGSKESGFVSLCDVRWSDVNLAIVKWSQMEMVGEECEARQKKHLGKVKDRSIRLDEYAQAVRANRQLASVLQAQGLNEDAARFAYRAQTLQRVVLRLQRKFAPYLFSLFLSLIAGYGYRLWQSFATYILVIVGFAAAYYLLGPAAEHSLSPLDAIVFSVISFHGRGFSPGGNIGLSNPLTILAAMEAFVGLVIEVTLIATLTQRFFSK